MQHCLRWQGIIVGVTYVESAPKPEDSLRNVQAMEVEADAKDRVPADLTQLGAASATPTVGRPSGTTSTVEVIGRALHAESRLAMTVLCWGTGVGFGWERASCRSRVLGLGVLTCSTTRLNHLIVPFQGRADY